MTPIDVARCLRGMAQLTIEGNPRPDAIADAIAAIQADPLSALKTRYIGVKNYAGFGDQREDHEYGFGPKYGDVVFRIGRRFPHQHTALHAGALDHDAIYLLEAYRDFPGLKDPDTPIAHPPPLTLCAVIRRLQRLNELRPIYMTALSEATVESHEQEPKP